ncbi:MAG: CoA pyrophosphatase [Cyclobacteriaceae bacterium]|nr:CoA pyrophosphatase [Cyclobacteriaceae bacterium]
MKGHPVIRLLSQRLGKPLPGADAHGQMRARPSSGARLSVRHTEPPRPGAVLILLYADKGRLFFPLIQRPSYEGVHGGQIGLPGGKQEPSDADLVQTALRETNEEIGVDKHVVHVLGSLTPFHVAVSNHMILPVVGFVEKKPVFVPDHQEVEEVIEAPLHQLLDGSYRKETEINVRGVRLVAPYFDLENRIVWGATAMMLSELASILTEPGAGLHTQ